MLQTRNKVKLSVSAALLFSAVISALIGIPGMMDDLAKWQEWIAEAHEVIPWEWAILAATGSLMGAIVPWIPWDRLWPASTTDVLVESTEEAGSTASPPQYPTSTTWLGPRKAFMLIRTSTLVAPPPASFEDIEDPDWEDIQHRKEARAGEMASMYLGDFGLECPDAVRDGKYGLQTFRWWIGKKIQDQGKNADE